MAQKLVFRWLPCQTPRHKGGGGVEGRLGGGGSMLGLVDPVSVCSLPVRWQVWYATFISVSQYFTFV